MRHYTTILIIVFTFIVIGIGTVGGCGSSGGGGGDDQNLTTSPTPTPVASPTPTPTPTPDPEPTACQSPPLNTDFGDTVVFFLDDFENFLIGIISDGEVVVILLEDLSETVVATGIFADVLSSDLCSIFLAVLDLDDDGDFTDELLLESSGLCGLLSDSTVFAIQDWTILDTLIGDLAGECLEVVEGVSAEDTLSGQAPVTHLEELADQLIQLRDSTPLD